MNQQSFVIRQGSVSYRKTHKHKIPTVREALSKLKASEKYQTSPTKNAQNPALNVQNPAQNEQDPAQNVQNPPQHAQNPAQSVQNPASKSERVRINL